MKNKSIVYLAIFILISVIIGGIFLLQNQTLIGPGGMPIQNEEPEIVACAQDLKKCPDGFYVSRVAPGCEFEECPESEKLNLQTYTNREYGFEFSFHEDYEDLWKFSEVELDEVKAIHAIDFFVEDFHLFRIYIRNLEWWKENAEIDQDGSVWMKGERGLPNFLGKYLGKNEKFAFTSSHNNQSCPYLGEEPVLLCERVSDDEDMISKSFKTIPIRGNINKEAQSEACSDLPNSWRLFEGMVLPLAFCYKEEWGKPAINVYGPRSTSEYDYQIGTSYYVSFPNTSFPLIQFSSQDYYLKGPDVGTLNWSDISLDKSEEELLNLLEGSEAVEKISLQKNDFLKVSGLQRGEDFHSIDYLVPNIEVGKDIYNFQTRYLLDSEKDTEILLESMVMY